MPLSKIVWTEKQSGWALWYINEDEKTLSQAALPDVCPEDIVSPFKRLEWLAGRLLIRTLVEKAGLIYKGLYKDKFGKPFLCEYDHSISLSHSYPYVAAQLDQFHPVGIDVEQPKEKLLKIAHRVLNEEEIKDAGTNIQKHCIYWCAKESLYKIYGKRGLAFSEHMSIQPFELGQNGDLKGSFSVDGVDQFVNLEYSLDKDFVLVYTKT